MMRGLLSLYSLKYPTALTYMLQNVEYRVDPYLTWYWRTQNFSKVMHRRELVRTKAARLLLLSLRLGMFLEILAGLLLIGLWQWNDLAGGWEFGLAALIAYPIVWAHLVVLPLIAGNLFIVKPRERRLIKKSETIFAEHAGVKIAIAGSYGKTSMKELLLTILSEAKKVAATPANKNVSISHAIFAGNLTGDEDILLIEYGEGAPGDVAHFAKITHPTHAIITGLAPAHLDRYKTLQAAGEDIFSVADYLQGNNVYVNGEASAVGQFIKESYNIYTVKGALGWKVKNLKIAIEGTEFDLTKGKRTLHLKSQLIGAQQVGPLTLAATLALELGLTAEQVVEGVKKTAPFEHRMQPYQMGGAWIIDDTYNGNIEGVKAGTELLKTLPATRKWYVTPGLVDQGKETKPVHIEMGKLIAAAKPDITVLMQNSVTSYIQRGLQEGGYEGEVRIVDDPLAFYTELAYFVAAGDVILMQNDWTDNYA